MESSCIWMSAGLIRYKLCDREFDCERCPLDAALRGEPGWQAADQPHAAEARRALTFPDDRHYSPGHLWLQARGEAACVGLDAIAMALVGIPQRLRWLDGAGAVRAGDSVLALDLPYGPLPLSCPATGRALRRNGAVERMPALLAEDPYGAGWLFEIEGAAGAARLVDASVALEQARLDLRHFRRRAALGLLTDAEGVGATMADGGEALTDVRRMLGPQRYLALIRELVH